MKNAIYFMSWLFVLLFNFGMRGGAQTKSETVDEMLKIYARQGTFNGVALVATQDSVLLLKSYNSGPGSLNAADMVFPIGSLTKPFTAVLILLLEQKHLLSVNDRLSKYLPDFPQADKISISQLLTHTSGIYNISDDSAFMAQHAFQPVGLDELIARFRNKPFYFEPGTSFRYSNSGYILLGKIIELVTRSSYFAAMHTYILDPLQMVHSGFDYKSIMAKRMPGLASTIVVDSTVSYAAGALYSSAGDLYLFNHALYARKLLDDSSVNKMISTAKAHYSFGWFIDTTAGNIVQLDEGYMQGFASTMVRIPANKTFIVLLNNPQLSQRSGLAKIAQDINAVLTDQPYDWPVIRPEIELKENILRQYVGEYVFNSQMHLVISFGNGQLFLESGSQAKTALFAEKEDLFFTKLIDSELQFTRDAEGRIRNLRLTQGTESWVARKIN